jgi:hypothetical protein
MSDQQQHLQDLLKQRESLIAEINKMQADAGNKRDLLLKIAGIIEYLEQMGVSLPMESKAVEAQASEPVSE